MTNSRERTVTPPRIAIATNNGDIGGGEVMLLNIAGALRELGMRVLVVGPREPGDLVAEAAARGFDVEILPASGRLQWMLALRAWRRRNRRVPLWCNGLVPSAATSLLGPRLVHLHIIPTGTHAILAALARIGARRTIVISRFMASRVRGRTMVLENWTEEIPFVPHEMPTSGEVRIGFLGRLTRDKGVDVLAEAITALDLGQGRSARLVLAGENRFGTTEDDRIIAQALAPLGDAVEHLGWVSREDLFSSVDVAVFPSTWDEPFGLVAAEAMAAGVPFVISDAGGLVEVAGLEHPWIARRGDAEDLARVLKTVIGSSSEARDRASKHARGRWECLFSPRAGAERVRRALLALPREAGHEDRRMETL
ncbi:glycosyltransferase family 4 protein [Brachybacterium timonense]|uniref:glycosyltransferase family 4 protein n=1 Tax=Brachybacterium timonense TaxID=2050896 RepID=UPI000D0AD1C1|nr:glycosyltransferase family 4 protein [Brachybacterium timonense]